jgi:hypothetical protein
MLSKYTAIAFPISALLLAATSTEHRRRFRLAGMAVAALATVLVLSPNLWWNAHHEWISIIHISENTDYGGSFFHPDRMLEFVSAQLGVFGPISFVVLAFMVVRWRTTTADPRLELLLFFVVPLLAAISIQALLSTAYANWAAPVYAAATVAVVAFLLDDHRRWLLASVVFNLVLGMSLYGCEPVRLALDLHPPKRLDPTFRVRGWPDVGAQLARIRSDHPDTLSLFEYGLVLAECLYYTPLPMDEVFFWNTDPVCRNHFELVNDIEAELGRDFLYISQARDEDLSEIRPYFDSVEWLDSIAVPTHPDRVLTLHVALARGFRGLPDHAYQAR